MKKVFLTVVAVFCFSQPLLAADVFFSEDEKAHNIITQGSPEELKSMLDAGYNVNKVYQCSTLLQKAIQSLMRTTNENNDSEATIKKIELLIAAGANVNKIACPQDGVSPLIWTMSLPLHAATVKNNINKILDNKMLQTNTGLCDFAPVVGKNCQDFNDADKKQIYDELRAAFDEYPQISTNDALKITSLLLKAGADINQQDITGRTALHLAVMLPPEIAERVVKYLINNGANVNVRDIYGQSPLFFAFDIGNTQVVNLLRQSGATLSFKNKQGALYNQKGKLIVGNKKITN